MMATKERERKALEQIRKIVAELGEDSYIGTAFEGCFEIAQQNIDNDFACSMKERKEAAEAAEDMLREKVAVLTVQIESHKKARELAERTLSNETARANHLADLYTEMKKLADEQEQAKVEAIGKMEAFKDMMQDKNEEIIQLKARLYDLMVK